MTLRGNRIGLLEGLIPSFWRASRGREHLRHSSVIHGVRRAEPRVARAGLVPGMGLASRAGLVELADRELSAGPPRAVSRSMTSRSGIRTSSNSSGGTSARVSSLRPGLRDPNCGLPGTPDSRRPHRSTSARVRANPPPSAGASRRSGWVRVDRDQCWTKDNSGPVPALADGPGRQAVEQLLEVGIDQLV